MTTNNDTLEQWLADCRKVTLGHIRRRPTQTIWPVSEQLAHVHSEVSEVYQAMRHGEGRHRIREEMTDVVYAGITLFHIAGFTDAEIMQSLAEVMWKISKRADVHQNIESFKVRERQEQNP